MIAELAANGIVAKANNQKIRKLTNQLTRKSPVENIRPKSIDVGKMSVR